MNSTVANRISNGTSRAKTGEGVAIKEPGTYCPTNKADRAQPDQDLGAVAHLTAITEQAPNQSRQQRYRAGRVRDFGIEPQPDQKRECQQHAAAGNRVHDAGKESGGEHQEGLKESHPRQSKGKVSAAQQQ